MKGLVGPALALLVLDAARADPGGSVWDHNGSLVTLRADGQAGGALSSPRGA